MAYKFQLGSFTASGSIKAESGFDAADQNISNVGQIALDTIAADNEDIVISLTDNKDAALEIKEGNNVYLKFDTQNSGGELVKLGKSLVPVDDSSKNLGASGTAFANLYVDAIDLNGQGSISMGGTGRIDLDADDDTSIRASADDVITFEASAADQVSISDGFLYPEANNDIQLGKSDKKWSNVHTIALSLNGTAVSATAAELNYLDNDDLSAARLAFLAGTTAGTAAASKAVVLDASKNIATINQLTASFISASEIQATHGTFSANSLIVGTTTISETEIAYLDGITAGTAAASKAMTWDGSSAWTAAGGTCANLGTVTTVDINGGTADNVVIGGSTAAAGTFTAVVGTSLSVSDGNITNVGNIALDSISADDTDINIACTDNSSTAFTIKQGSDAYFIVDTGNSDESISIGTGVSGTAISIGHSTSEVTINDNLTVTGDLTINGTTTSVNSTTINITSSFTFEGTSPDANETVLGVVDPTADATINLPAMSAGTYYLPVLAAASTVAIDATPAEINAIADASARSAAAVDVSADHFMFCDGGATGAYKVESLADYATAIAGSGLAAASGVLSVDIDELSALGGTGLHQTQDHFMFSDNGTEKKITFSNLQDAIFADVSGDATIAAGGALTIANDAVEQAMIADDAVGADQLAASAVVNASVVDGSIKADKLDIDGSTDIGAALAAGDLLIVDDGAGGTNRKCAMSRVKTFCNALDVSLKDDTNTLAEGVNYFADFGGAESVSLPASPTVGVLVRVKAPSNCSSTNTLTINRQGSHTIDGATAIVLESPHAAVDLVYVVSNVWKVF